MEQCIGGVTFNTCRKFVIDKDFFRFVNVNIIQRQVTSYQRLFLKIYYANEPKSMVLGLFITLMIASTRMMFLYTINPMTRIIHRDIVIILRKCWMQPILFFVTTDELGNYYKERFGTRDEQIIVIPNYIPFWWMGSSFNKERIMVSFKTNEKHRPRIGIIDLLTTIGNKKVENITHLLPYKKDH